MYPQQGGYPNQQQPGGQAPPGYPQGGQPGMGGYPQQGGYPPQQGMGYPQQGGYPPQQMQGGMMQQRPGMQPGYPGGQPGMYPQQGMGMQQPMGGMGMGMGMQQGGMGMGMGMQQPNMGMGMGMQPNMGMGMGGMQPAMGMGGGVAIVSVFQAATTFQVRRNFFMGGGEMDIMMNGQPYFRCISTPSPFGYGYSFNLCDMMGNQLCYIQPDQSFGKPHFHIYLRGMLYATMKQDWSAFEKKFEVHNKVTGEELKVFGDWFSQNFEFQRRHSGQQVAQVSSNYNGDMYDVIVYPGEDALFVLAAALTIEKLCHEHKHHHKHSW